MNRDRARRLLAAAGVDVFVAVRPENVRWITGLPLDLAIALDLPVAVLLRREPLEIAAIVAPGVMAGAVGSLIVGAVTTDDGEPMPVDPGGGRLYGRFHALAGDPANLSATEAASLDLLRDSPGRGLGFERALRDALDGLPGADRLAWDDARVAVIAADAGRPAAADGESLARVLRRVKTPAEIELLARAAGIAEDAEGEIMRRCMAGADWAEVIADLPRLVAARGGVFGFFTGGAGRQSGFVYPASRHLLVSGDLIRLDIGLTFGGYWSDTGRTACVGGEPAPAFVRRHEAIRRAVEAVLDAIRPGVQLASLYELAVDEMRHAIPGYDRHHCGHGIGLRAYEGDLVAPGDTTALETGMTLNIEVPYYEIGGSGLQLEETVVVEASGCRLLTHLPREILATGSSAVAS